MFSNTSYTYMSNLLYVKISVLLKSDVLQCLLHIHV